MPAHCPRRPMRVRSACRLTLLSSCLLWPALGRAQDGAEEATLPTITVNAAATATEGSGAYVAPAPTTTATGLPLSPRETPQSVSVVTNQQITDQNAQTITDVLDFATGLSASQGNGEARWLYYARGFAIDNMQYDGVPNYSHFYSRDINAQENMAMYDRIEIVRGATGLMEGTGSPAASINLVRKRPLDIPRMTLDAQATSYGSAELTFDATRPLNQDGTVRGRFIANGTAGNGYRDDLDPWDGLLYGVIDADLGPNTTASLGLSYQRERIDGYSWGGLPTQEDGGFFDYDPKTSPSLPWEYSDRTTTIAYLNIDHRLDNGWTLAASGRAGWSEAPMLSSYLFWAPAGNPDCAEGELCRSGGLYNYENDIYALDARASGPVTLFGRSHDLVLGMNGNRDYTHFDSPEAYMIGIPDPLDLGTPDEPGPAPRGYESWADYRQQQYGLYGAGRFSITDALKVVAGARVSWFRNSSAYPSGESEFSADGEWIPYLGALYDIGDYTLYASYTEIFQPISNVDPSGQLLNPVTGKSYEVGVKGEFLDGALNASLALFQSEQTGLAESLPPTACDIGVPSCSTAAGEVRARGVELEVVGAPTPDWNLSFGYTYADPEYTEGDQSGEGYNTAAYPRHLAKLSTTYRLPGAWKALTLGGAVRAQSELVAEGTGWSNGIPYRIDQPAYAVADLMARYQVSEVTSVQLNVDNIFDKTYYSAISDPGYGNFMGQGRTFAIGLSHTF